MKRNLFFYLLAGFVALLVASCSSTRRMQKTPMIGGLTGTDYMEKVIEWAPRWQCVTGKVALNLNTGKSANKVSATLRIKRGDVIQLSVALLLGIEVARMEITPEGILVVDRMNKRYVRESFGAISELAHVDLNFNMLQSLFLNELFLPRKTQLSVADASDFTVIQDGTLACLEPKSGRILSCRFWTTADQGLLEKTRIGVKGSAYGLDWAYSDFGALDGKNFPQHMLVNVLGIDKPISLDMKFSRLSVNSDWETRTELSSRYQRIELAELLKMLLKL